MAVCVSEPESSNLKLEAETRSLLVECLSSADRQVFWRSSSDLLMRFWWGCGNLSVKQGIHLQPAGSAAELAKISANLHNKLQVADCVIKCIIKLNS